jgi:2-keto-3-deoxy-L-rhamnonate aldolase RhmA
MAVYRFKDVRGFEAAVGRGSDFTRFTLTPALATEWLGISSTIVSELIGTGGVDVVLTDDGHTFLDGDELAACQRPAKKSAAAGWFRKVLAS